MQHYCELALIYGFPLFLQTKPKGRLKNLCDRLQKECIKDLNKIIISQAKKEQAVEKIDRFFKKTGWFNQSRHVLTFLSFCLSMIENSDYKYNPKIIGTLNDIVEFLERKEAVKIPCCWAGDIAAEKWRRLF